MSRVVIGMDPHKRSATIEVMAADETVLGGVRFATDADGYTAMLRNAKQWPDRVWAVERCNGIGRHVAYRLLVDGEQVVDVPPKLSARARCSRPGRAARPRAEPYAHARPGQHLLGRVAALVRPARRIP